MVLLLGVGQRVGLLAGFTRPHFPPILRYGCRRTLVPFSSGGEIVFTLRLFGGFWLEGPSGPLDGRVLQRRQASLLALLGATSGAVATRDWLLLRFCPDLPDARARRRLSDALYVIRKEVGEGAVRSHGDQLRLDGGVVRCDVQRFLSRLAGHDREGALALYGGPFLDGFHGVETGEFEGWQHRRRERLALLAARAAGELSLEAEATGDLEAALRWERRRGEIEPYDEPSVRRRLLLLDRLGNRGEALTEYEAFRTELASAFQVRPSAETRRVVQALRGEDSRPLEGRTARPERPGRRPGAEEMAAARRPAGERPSRRPAGPAMAWPDLGGGNGRRWATAAAVVVLFALAAWLDLEEASTGSGGGAPKAVAVLAFEDLTEEPDGKAVSAGLTRHLISRLSALEEVDVAATGSVTGPDSWREGPGGAPGVDCVVEGDVQRDGSRLRVGVRLVDVRTERNLWARVFHGDVRRLLDLENAVARAVGEAILQDPGPARDVSRDPAADSLRPRPGHAVRVVRGPTRW